MDDEVDAVISCAYLVSGFELALALEGSDYLSQLLLIRIGRGNRLTFSDLGIMIEAGKLTADSYSQLFG